MGDGFDQAVEQIVRMGLSSSKEAAVLVQRWAAAAMAWYGRQAALAPAGVRALVQRLGVQGHDPPETADGRPDEADFVARLPRRAGWSRVDWQPAATGPLRSLICHCQSQADRAADGSAITSEASPWRFEVGWVDAEGRSFALFGRLDGEGLHLLIRADQWFPPAECRRLDQIARDLRLANGRGVTLRFDIANPAVLPSGARQAIDRRA